MLAIILQACLISSPAQCEEHKIPIMSGGTTHRCAMLAPVRFARWADSHPDWQIRKWRCGVLTDDAE